MPSNYHALYDRDVRAGAGQPRQVVRQQAGTRRLSQTVTDLVASYDDATGMPIQLTTALRAPLGSGATNPEQAATRFLEGHADLWNLTRPDLDTVEISSVSTRGLRVVRLIQRVSGVEVFGSEVTLGLNDRNEILASSGQFFRGVQAHVDGHPRDHADPGVDARIAVARATSDLTDAHADPADFALAPLSDRGGYRAVLRRDPPTPRPRMTRPARTKDVLFPLGGAVFRQGCYVELWLSELPVFSYVIDVQAPHDVLFRNCLTADVAFAYLVHNTGDRLFRPLDSPAPGTPHPSGVPNGFQAPTVAERAVTVESLIGDPWLSEDATTTEGNNCVAYADVVSPDGQDADDIAGLVTSPGEFGQTYDHDLSATAAGNVQNGIVGMFFHVNWAHDRWYAAGFDEAAGNAQEDNFGRGGLDGDPILAEANDFSKFNNANMNTPADGDSPLMQMFVFPGPTPDRTSNHEALITLHELGHYMTTRLVGNANGLVEVQGRALMEGWGDFFGICMTSQPGDDFLNGCFGAQGWCALLINPRVVFPGDEDRKDKLNFRDNYYFGLRRYPYSFRDDKNPLSFRHIRKGEDLPAGPPIAPLSSEKGKDNHEAHNAGEVWCSALWDIFVNLVGRHGHTHAERRMLHYVIGGLGLTPNQPTFVQARQGIIAAVTSIDQTDLRPVWAGFAKRGLGLRALAPASDSKNLKDLIESFEIPFGLPADTKISVLCAINQLL